MKFWITAAGTAIVLSCAFFLHAQDSGPRLRISVTVVQVDAIVTDKQGKQVTDLTKDDFEVFEDGKPRTITNFSYIRTGVLSAGSAPGATNRSGSGGPVNVSLQREDIRRTVVLLVDDLRMSFESINSTRQALSKFVDQQMEPGDLVAVMTTSGGIGRLQQFTTDKKLLHAAIDRIRFYINGGEFSAVKGLGGGRTESEQSGAKAMGNTSEDPTGILQLAQRRFAVGTIGTIRYVTEGMRDMPGRKSLVFVSDGFPITDKPNRKAPITAQEMRRVTDRVNRSGVVIYSIDPRGLVWPGLQAQDDVAFMDQVDVIGSIDTRLAKIRDAQESLYFLATETGGLPHFDGNDMNLALRKIMDDQVGYYLLGFQADDRDAERIDREGKYHSLSVKVKRPGLRVRHRRGFMGGDGQVEEPRTPAERVIAALASPFAGTDIRLRFTPMFALGDKGEAAVQAMIHIDGNDLAFTEPNAEGYHSAKLRIVVITEGEDPQLKGTTERVYTVRVKSSAVERLKKEGLVYSLQHEVRKPGPYQMRVAVLDEGSGKVGAASRFVEIPNMSKRTLAISGIVMREGDLRVETPPKPEGEEVNSPLRIFRRTQTFSYAVVLYNPPFDEATRRPRVELRPRLIRGNQVVWEGKRFPVILPDGVDPRRIPSGGVLTLGEKTQPGEYILEVQALNLAGQPTASQWIDFELR